MDNRDSVLLDIGPTEFAENKKTRVMHIYQIIRIFSNACDQKNVAQLKRLQSNNTALQNIDALKTVTEDVLSKPKSRNDFRNHVIDCVLNETYKECQDDNHELLFFASAKFDLTRLQEVVKELKKDPDPYPLNQTRYSDSVIVFLLKYADLNNENFFNCIKFLIEAGVDVNVFDIKGKTAIDYVALLYGGIKDNPQISQMLKDIAQLFLDRKIFKPDNKKTLDFLTNEMGLDVDKYEFNAVNEKTKLFYWIITNQSDDFLAFKNIKQYVESDNGENTLLQLASKKTDNMLPVVQFLLKNGADPNKVTTANPQTPLELAAVNKNQKIFEELLKNKKTEIRQKQYNNFVRWRGQGMKPKLFEMLLESGKLDPNLTYDRTGNTPLHYAILFCHKKAVQSLLKQNSSLLTKNKFGFCALDLIDSEDLEKYFDSCLALDNYTPYFSDINYKMRLRFNCLIDVETFTEVRVVSKIGKHPNLEYLLMHPFINTFICLKWFKVKLYFWVVLLFQAILFLLLAVLFYRVPKATTPELVFCILLALVNFALKTPIFLYFNTKQSRPKFFALNRATLHSFIELLLIVTMIGGFFQKQFRAFVFVEMAISFLLTAGYHPNLSKWSLMLQQVFKTFTILLIFFSLIVVAISLGFHILFPNDAFFKSFFSSVFMTFIMTTGEINIEEDMGFEGAGFGGYLLFFLYAMSVSLVIVNFWTGVAVTDIERIEKNAEINASKNVIIFMLFADFIYSVKFLAKLRKHVPTPLLFLRISDDGSIFHNPEKSEIDFFVNKGKQFEEKGGFPTKVDDECFDKIRRHYYKLVKVSSEQVILDKLEELSKSVTEIKSKYMKSSQSDLSSLGPRPKKQFKKKEAKQ